VTIVPKRFQWARGVRQQKGLVQLKSHKGQNHMTDIFVQKGLEDFRNFHKSFGFHWKDTGFTERENAFLFCLINSRRIRHDLPLDLFAILDLFFATDEGILEVLGILEIRSIWVEFLLVRSRKKPCK
jgi:hypothetical protein